MKKISAAIIGLGYVGLPLAVLLKKKKSKFLDLTQMKKIFLKLKKVILISQISRIKKFPVLKMKIFII